MDGPAVHQTVTFHRPRCLPASRPIKLSDAGAIENRAHAHVVSFGYVLVSILVFLGPYGPRPILIAWLTALAFYPLGLFSVWFFRIRVLNQAIKFSFARCINDAVQDALQTVQKTEGLEPVARLEKLVAVQTSVEKIRSWPLDLQTSLTLLVALLTAIGQTLLLATQAWKR